MGRNEDTAKGVRRPARIPVAEWLTGGLGMVLAVAAVAILSYEAFFVSGPPPDIDVSVESVGPVHGGWLVEIVAGNIGGSTAAEVRIEGRLTLDGREVEKAETVLDYVPVGSRRHAGLYFTRDPAAFDIDLRATGYADP